MNQQLDKPPFFQRLEDDRFHQVGIPLTDRGFLYDLADRHLELARRGVPDEATAPLLVDAARYTDPAIHAREQENLFARLPQVAGLSRDIAAPGDYLVLETTETPIIVVRDRDGIARAFVNACRHRGAELVHDSRGKLPLRLSCPYHGWTYDLNGRLIGQPCQSAFTGIDRATLGLVPVACEERHGLLFVAPHPAQSLDLDSYLGDALDGELAGWNYGQLQLAHAETMELAGNWKLALDSFCEFYHFDYAHQQSLAHYYNSNVKTVDELGQHLRISASLKSIVAEYPSKPVAERLPENYVHVTYLLFPNTVLVNTQQVMELFHIAPDGVGKMRLQHRCYSRLPLEVPENAALIDAIWQATHHIVRNEDMRCSVEGVQQALASGALPTLVFGRNEWPAHLMHQRIGELIGL